MLTPPDPIPPPVKMGERRARTTLRAIAAIHDGWVVRMADVGRLAAVGRWGDRAIVGLAVMPRDCGQSLLRWTHEPTWVWSTELRTLFWDRPDMLGGATVPLGRLDRGLGAQR